MLCSLFGVSLRSSKRADSLAPSDRELTDYSEDWSSKDNLTLVRHNDVNSGLLAADRGQVLALDIATSATSVVCAGAPTTASGTVVPGTQVVAAPPREDTSNSLSGRAPSLMTQTDPWFPPDIAQVPWDP
ncbi:hypothetical protein Taro_003808 [Colocasia esculenta]|uniref:Uncharacterized protein n=1 Tax=Colocasia esculenta TaxID=4460 RepID=A0A843TKF0_COLES|nr:hypothetical protein [Colocasia esculenta]